MKEIKKERQRIETYTLYEAVDGTKFTDKDACEAYEKTISCIIRSKVMKLVVAADVDAWTLMGGCDDNTVTAFKLVHQSDVDNIKQFFLIENPWFTENGRKDRREEIFNIIDTAYQNNDIILFGINCDGGYYFINSRKNIISNLMALGDNVENYSAKAE